MGHRKDRFQVIVLRKSEKQILRSAYPMTTVVVDGAPDMPKLRMTVVGDRGRASAGKNHSGAG
jgi:hypothetical protein